MATFDVKVVKIQRIDEHTNADALELATVHGYRSVVRKGQFRAGDLAVYIPEAALIPEYLLKRLGLWDDVAGKGRLNGPDGNRVKAVKLRGEVSQGILLGLEPNPTGKTRWSVTNGADETFSVLEGVDVKDALGIKKWEPEIPASMSGEVTNVGQYFPAYDIENQQRYPEVLQPYELVTITEKLHGTNSQFWNIPGLNNPNLTLGEWAATSKGVGAQGLVMMDREANARNIYLRSLRAALDWDLAGRLLDARKIGRFGLDMTTPICFYGETFGKGVQDLSYGLDGIQFRGFDIYIGTRSDGRWLDVDDKLSLFDFLGFPVVPVLYRGPWNLEVATGLRDGNTTIGPVKQIREGIVVTPDTERRDDQIGRVILKMVSPDYLLRKGGGTEFN